jgi:hypothetical protein
MIVVNETDRWIAHLSYTIELKTNRILTVILIFSFLLLFADLCGRNEPIPK